MAKTINLDPDTHRRLQRIAKQRRWTLKVAADEAVRALENHGSAPDRSEPSVAGSQIDSDLAAENSSKASEQGQTE